MDASLVFSHAKLDGGDIRVYSDKEGTSELAVDIEYFDSSAKDFVIWVKIPSLSSIVTTTIWVAYGNSALSKHLPSDPYGSQAVWQAAFARYSCANATGTNLVDSKGTGNDWTPDGFQPDQVDGKFYKAQRFDGSDDYYKSPVKMTPDGTTSFAVSFWMRSTQSSVGNGTTDQWWNGTALIDADISGTANDWGVSMQGGATSIITMGMGQPDATLYGSTQVNDGNWHYVVAVFNTDNATSNLYVDGSLEASGVLSNDGQRANTSPTMGRLQSSSSNFYAGDIDQVMFRHSQTSNARQKAEYQFLNFPQNNLTVGPSHWVGKLDYKDSILKTTSPGSNGEQEYVDPNNTDSKIPTAVLVYHNVGPDFSGSLNNTIRSSFGFSDGNTQQVLYWGASNGTDPSQVGRFGNSDAIIGMTNAASNGTDNLGNFVSFGANSVKINWTQTTFSGRNIAIKFIYGVPVNLSILQPNTTINANASITGLEFTPNLMMTLSLRSGINGSSSSGNGGSLGFVSNYDDSIQQGCQSRNAQGSVSPPVIAGIISQLYCVSEIFNSQTKDYDLEVTSFNSDGATFTSRNNAPNTNRRVAVLSIGMPDRNQAKVTFQTLPGTSGLEDFPVSFRPNSIQSLAGDITNFDTFSTTSATAGYFFSIFDETDQACFTQRNRHGTAPQLTRSFGNSKPTYYQNTGGTVQHDSTFSQFKSTGWEENFSVATDTSSMVSLALKHGYIPRLQKSIKGNVRGRVRGGRN
jgi:hypothetical protein